MTEMRLTDGRTVVVRPETPDDAGSVRAVVAAAFDSDAEADLVEAIRASPGYLPDLTLVATIAGRVVGHVMVGVATLRHAGGDRQVAQLAPLAVDPAAQQLGIGSLLVREVLTRADARGEPIVVLEGSPAYYGRLGFVPASEHGISLPLPDWAPPEAAQVHLLSRHAPDDATLRGRVVYPPPFDALD